MKKEDLNLSNNQVKDLLFASTFLSLSKYIQENELTRNDLTEEVFFELILSFREKKLPYHIYVHPFDKHRKSIEALISQKDYVASLILISAVMEEHINSIIRNICYVKGFSHNNITEYIKSLNFKTKLKFILPLLNCKVNEKYLEVLFQFNKNRNKIIHNEALPSISIIGEKDLDGSRESNINNAKSLIDKYSFESIIELSDISDNELYKSVEPFKLVWELFDKYFN